MAKVVDLERFRVERLAGEIVPWLRDRGSVLVETSGLESVERWRRAARRAGRLLGWRVRTGVSPAGDRVWAVSDDYEVDPAQLADAMTRMTLALTRSWD